MSDRARRTYDPRRMYRSVVSQQGRVTLEADANEAEEIRAEESRAELIDVVGPSGSPDRGFEISVPAGLEPFDFSIGAGTLYVGGVRVTNTDHGASYVGQRSTEWTDHPAGSTAVEPTDGQVTEVVYLSLGEQEVTAVEDEALREVALGGPDTSARIRLIQRVQRWPVNGTSCEAAFAEALKNAFGQTSRLDRTTMRLESRARLRVDFLPPADPTDVCQPTAQAGFLGPENQLIRVQVLDTDTMLWGWDNASFLYRVTVADPPGPTPTLTLSGIPVDVFHQPRPGQWVELLRAAVDLREGAHVASPVGVALQVDGYDPTSRVVTLRTAIPAELVDILPLFLRIWENKLPFAADETTPTELVDAANIGTGVRVFTTDTPRVPGDHWMIGVRPSTPQSILPARLATFQPPDGPRRWVAPLAVIEWDQEGRAARVTDCRPPFLDLVELTSRRAGCCELVVTPGESVQAAIDSLPPEGGAVCLKAGTHRIETAIRIARSGVTVHGESAGAAVVEASLPAAGPAPAGAVMLEIGNGDQGLSDVTIQDLVFVVTQPTANSFAGLVQIDRCTRTHVHRCRFTVPVRSETALAMCAAISATGCRDLAVDENVLEGVWIGLIATAALGVIEVRHNSILGLSVRLPLTPGQAGEISAGHLGIGVLQDPAGVATARALVEHNKLAHFRTGIGIGPTLDGSSVHDNTIGTGLATAIPGPFPAEDAELPGYLDAHGYAISCASSHCAIRANRIDLRSPSWGGIRITSGHTAVEANVIVASPLEGQGSPVGILATAVSSFQGAHHAMIRDNVLVGPLAGISASGCAVVEISRNHIEGAGGAPYAVALLAVPDEGGLLAVADAVVKDNRVAGIADGRAAMFANGGHQNRFEGNLIRGCWRGIVTREQTDVELRANSVEDARMGGISLERFSGIAYLVGNRVLNCGYLNELGHGIDVQGVTFTGGAHLRVENCDVLDTGVGGLGQSRAVGIFAIGLQSCQLIGNRVGYSSLEVVKPTDPHPAIALTGLNEESTASGQVVISANQFSGTGPMLAAVSGFRNEAFSNNICTHVTVEGGATVVLSGAHLIALGNHIEANDREVPSFRLYNWAMASLTGNITTGDVDANPPPTPVTLVPDPYPLFNIRL